MTRAGQGLHFTANHFVKAKAGNNIKWNVCGRPVQQFIQQFAV